MKEIVLVYLVAGLSNRFGGEIKQFAQITDKETFIEYSLNQAIPAGFTKIIFIVGDKTELPFKKKFGDSYKGIPVKYCLQKYNPKERDKPWGTTEALCCAKEILDSVFIVCNGDDLYGEDTFKILVEHLKNKNTCASIIYRLGDVLSENGTVNRGIFHIKENKAESIEEFFNITKENLELNRLSEDSLSSQNIFALSPEVIEELEKRLIKFKEKNKGNRKIECILANEISNLLQNKKIIIELYRTPNKWLGITNPGDELKIREKLNKQNL